MRLARLFGYSILLAALGLSAQAVPQPAQIQVVQNLVIPGRVADLMPDAMLLKAPSGEAFVLPRHLGVRLEDSKVHPQLAVGSQVSVMVPLDSSEVVSANGRLVVLKTGTGQIQLPVSMMPKDMLSSTLIATRDRKGQHKETTLVNAIQSGGLVSPESFAYWNQPRTASGVVVAKRTEGDLLLATIEDGLPAIRQLKTGGLSTDWITIGSPVTVVRDPQMPFYQVTPWKDSAYWTASQQPVPEVVAPVKVVRRGVVPRQVTVAARRPDPRSRKHRVISHLPTRHYPRATARKTPVVARAVEESTSLLVPIYHVVSAPLKSLASNTASSFAPAALPTYADQQLDLVPGYNSKTRIKDTLPGY